MVGIGHGMAFILFFYLIYGLMHLYLLVKVRRAFYVEGLSYLLLLAALLFLLLAPVQARIMYHQGHVWSSLLIAWFGYLWMGYLFLFICLAIPLDAYHLAMAAAQELRQADWTRLMLSRRQNCLLVALAAGGLMTYGVISAYQVPVNRMSLVSDKIPESIGQVRVVQISDLHLGPMTYPGRLAPILAALRQAEPDILVSTGNLVDGPLRDGANIAAQLKALPAPLGKFAVTGNHEYHMGLTQALAFMHAAGFVVLHGASVEVADGVVLAGVDDPAGGGGSDAVENRIRADLSAHSFAILLKHRPTLAAHMGRHFDLQLSGHTRGGQIFPLSLLIRAFYPRFAGWHQGESGHYLYVSRGTGTWGPPIRILARPEITVIDLVSEGRQPQQTKSR